MIRLTVLGSGSSGNSTLIESDDCRLLIDAGFSARQITARLATLNLTPAHLTAILLTHEHSDHTTGLPPLCKQHNLPIYTNRLTAEALRPKIPTYTNWRLFETGTTFPIHNLTIETFPIPHDAYDPVGYTLTDGTTRIGLLTDLGYATKLIIERARRCQALLLESNHDLALLQADTKRPWATKQRILSRHGHLSNNAAAHVACEIANPTLTHLILGHLSPDCNTPHLAHTTVATALAAKAASLPSTDHPQAPNPQLQIHVAAQDVPSPTLCY